MSITPTIMVSSTFYDLQQIRADIREFIQDELGYIALLSEYSSFPIDPNLNTLANCRSRVQQYADIFILVIGGRYGSIDLETDKSITNLEYLEARQKGIPIYVFIKKDILSVLPVWKKNRDSDFSDIVDTTRLFEFVELVTQQEKIWYFPFETAQEIVATLRMQMAHLFYDALTDWQRFRESEFPSYLSCLEPKALKLAIEKPEAWEWRLFFQIWLDELDKQTDLIMRYREGLALGSAEYVKAKEAAEWLRTRLHEASHLVEAIDHLVNNVAPVAFGPTGFPGDLVAITWVAREIVKVAVQLLTWVSNIRCALVEEPFDEVASQLSTISDDAIDKILTFPVESLPRFEQALATSSVTNPQTLDMILRIDFSNSEAFFDAIEKASRRWAAMQG